MSAAKQLRLLIGVCFVTCVAADDGDDFSNNLFSDLAPLLALFGERVTMQFMSQSTGWFDNIVLAMAPLGIITTIVGAIRVGGPSWLKALIGRARESRAVVEAELMSSTSHEVCELWNGQQVVRVMGKGPIREFIILLPEDEPANRGMMQRLREWFAQPAEGRDDSLGDLSGAKQEITKVILKEDEKQVHLQERKPTIRERVFGERFRQPKNAEAGESLSDRSVFVLRNTAAQAPNLTLNVHNQLSRGELYVVALFGIILQLGVLAYSTCITYLPAFTLLKDGNPVARYAYPCTAVGTLLLVVGVLVCSHVVENSTEEATYFPGPSKKARVIWLQRSGTVSDQAFESFAIFPQEAQVLVRTSQRAPEPGQRETSKKDSANVSRQSLNETKGQSRPASEDGRSTQPSSTVEQTRAFPSVLEPVSGYLTSENVKTVGGTGIGICGFIVQFTGLRGMHWSASVAQLGATVLMTILRAWVRRDLAELPRALPIVSRHELDWLAMTFGGKPAKAPWRQPPGDDGKWDKDCRPWADDEGWDWKTIAIQDPAELEELQPYLKESCDSQSRAGRVMKIRRDLGKLADWHGPASAEAIMLARAIEIAMDALLGNLSGNFTWPVKVGDEEIHFRLDREDRETKGWRTYADEIEAALSLWLYSVENKERRPAGDGNTAVDDDKWLRSKETSAKPSLRLIGSFTQALHQDLRWWMPEAAVNRVVRAEQTSTGHANTVKLQAHRVVGFVAGSSSQSTGQAEQVRYTLQPFGEQSSKRAPSQGADTANALLAVESYSPLATLFAQHMFSSFMWAAAKKMEDKDQMASKVEVRPTDTDGVNPDTTWKSFTLHNNQLSAMAQAIQSTGLGTLEEVYMCIIPPLSTENKLPRPSSIIDWTRTHAERHERRGQWKEAGDAYMWLFRTTRSTQGQGSIAIKATALLMEFLVAVTDAVKLRKAQKFEERAIEELDRLKSNLLSELRSHTLDEPDTARSISVLASLMWLFQEQRRPWGCPFAQALEPPEDKDVVLRFKYLHRRAAQGKGFWDMRSWMLENGVNTSEKDILDWTPLHYAVTSSLEVSETMLGCRVDVNARDIRGRTPLHYACLHNNNTAVESFLREGAEINRQDMDGRAPIHHAAEQGHSPVIQSLIEAGADLNLADALGYTPLFWAAYNGHRDSVDHLRKGSNITLRDYNGRVVLHLAVMGESNVGERKEAVGLLVKQGALIEARDRFGRTPLHYAAQSGRESIVQLLLENGAAIEAGDQDRKTALHHAVESGYEAIVRLLLENGATAKGDNIFKTTPLHSAAKSGYDAIVRLLLENGAAIEAKGGPRSRTPLYYAVKSGSEDTVRLLLENGALIQARDKSGETPMHYAAANGHGNIIRLLLENGAAIGVGNSSGATALHSAALHGRKAVIQLLLGNGAAVDARDHYNRTPLHFAVFASRKSSSYKDIVQLLLENGPSTMMETRDNLGNTALYHAAENGCEDIVRLLLEKGAPIKGRDGSGRTALHAAAGSGCEDTVRLLLDNGLGTMMEAKDDLGQIALHSAADRGYEDIARLLLENGPGAMIEARDDLGQTPRSLAAKGGHEGISDLFQVINPEVQRDDGVASNDENAVLGSNDEDVGFEFLTRTSWRN